MSNIKQTYLYRMLKKIYRAGQDFASSVKIHKVRVSHPKSGLIKVGFLAQEPSIWDKLEPVYFDMKNSRIFETCLFVVPPVECYDINNSKYKDYSFFDNYFFKRYPEAIKTIDNGQMIDLSKFGLDYLFYQRPYDDLLPEQYKSKHTSGFVGICYLAYFNSINTIFKNIDNFHFLKNARIVFLTCDEEVQYEKRELRLGCLMEAHKILNVGYPMLDRYFKLGSETEGFTLLWTPRWTPELQA